MKKVKWEMNEQFAFPDFAGIPTGAETLSVTPMFSEERNEDAVRLTGIYHIAANVSFNEGESGTQIPEGATLIDDVDLNEQMGYFEYAVPLNIDLPSEVDGPLDVVVKNTQSEVDDKGIFEVVWNVECTYKEAIAKPEETKQIVEEVKKEQVAEKAKEEQVAEVAKKEQVAEKAKEEQVVDNIKESQEVVLQQVEDESQVEATEVVLEESEAPKVSDAMIAISNTSSLNADDEVLSFIGELSDGLTMTLFRSNDVFVERES